MILLKAKTWHKHKLLGWVGLVLLTALSSCLDNDRDMTPTPVSYVSFYHGAPNTASLQIEVDNKLYNTNTFNYGTYFDYYNFYTGKRNFSFKAVNATNSLFDTTVTFVADKAYSFFLSEEGESFEPIVVEDELKNPAEGKALIRMVHLSPDAPQINLQINDSDAFLFEEQASYKDVSDFESIDAAVVSLHIKTGLDESPVVSANNINIREGRIYTLVVRGYASATAGSSDALSIQLLRNYPNY